ncbi:restriction endonuclease subunit S [Methylomonas sp. BW4-1]|uniref:restriction endonuclease subunit S n=1 Tax=Methylomonas sp. BW4-1 TaxID=3376685 RepID=UPI00404264C5
MIYQGNHKLGDFFISRRERGTPGLPMLSVTMNNGVVTRESLDRKMETNLSDEDHLLVRKDDIVYNMMRMWQGASGLADRDGLLSPAYVVLAPKKGIDPLYASYLFKSSRLIYLLWAYSYGLTSDRLRLYFNDFKRIPVNIPSLPEQRKIGKILSTWDKAIEITEKLIDNSKAQKTALMQQLLAGRVRISGFNDEWKAHEFSNIASLSNKKFNPKHASESLPCLELEHLSQLTGELLGSIDSTLQQSIKNLFEPGNVLFGKLRPYLRKFWFSNIKGVCSTEIWVLKSNNDICLPEYLFYLVQSDHFIASCHVTSGSKMPRADWDYVSATPFYLPTLEEQKTIIDLLRSSSNAINILIENLNNLKQEKIVLMEQLLTGKRRVKVDES